MIRDKVNRERELGNRITKSEAKKGVKTFIQIIHHYRDAYLVDPNPPYDHVAIFDEAQRAWNKDQTVKFMRQKRIRVILIIQSQSFSFLALIDIKIGLLSFV